MKTRQQSVMFRIGSNNEFDLYFARAALEEMETGAVDARRGSLPSAPPKQLIILSESPKRTHSCKYPARSRRKHGSVSPQPPRGDHPVVSPPPPQGQDPQDTELQDVKISVPLEPPKMNHSLLAPGPRVDFKCHSAPHSRSSSWRKTRRPPSDRSGNHDDELGMRRESVPFEESISARLEQLRLLEAEDCCVVRNFATSARGLVNRGDSFKRKSFSVASDTGSNGSGIGEGDRSVSAHSIGGSTIGSSCDQPIFRVLMVGAHGVGKTALVQQFMTSEYMGALDTSFGESLMTV